MLYIESFDDGPGGWIGWTSHAAGAQQLEIRDSTVISRSPWWVDYNHAPPGGGYLHLLFCLYTRQRPGFQRQDALGGINRFASGGFSTDFTNARVTIRAKGEIDLKGAQMLLLVQAKVGPVWVDYVCTANPFWITHDWSEQTATLRPDAAEWKCMGSRHDRRASYGWGNIADVLRHLNENIIFVLHPLQICPKTPLQGDLHMLKAGEDYELDRTLLPEGYVMLDEVRIEFTAGP